MHQRKIEAQVLQIVARFFHKQNSQNCTQNRGSIFMDFETSILSQFSTKRKVALLSPGAARGCSLYHRKSCHFFPSKLPNHKQTKPKT
jgi:hypothetical protein